MTRPPHPPWQDDPQYEPDPRFVPRHPGQHRSQQDGQPQTWPGQSAQAPEQPQQQGFPQRPVYPAPQPGWQGQEQPWGGDPGYQQPPYGYQQPPPPPPYGYQQPPRPPGRPPRKRRRGLKIAVGIAGAFVLLVVIISVASNGGGSGSPSAAGGTAPSTGPSSPAAAAAQSAAPAKAAAHQTVTYVVRGSAAQVTYGPSGSDLNGTVPMHITKRLGSPQFYSVQAQLQGGGSVTCKILVDGKAISVAHATGSYNIAMCEISQDPFSGKWQDTNSQ